MCLGEKSHRGGRLKKKAHVEERSSRSGKLEQDPLVKVASSQEVVKYHVSLESMTGAFLKQVKIWNVFGEIWYRKWYVL